MLTDLERKVLAGIELNAERPITDLSRELGVQVHSLRYAIERLSSRGIIWLYPFIDVFPLGYRILNLYFSIDEGKIQLRDKLLNQIIAHPQVSWLCELGGEYGFCASFLTRRSSDVLAFVEQLSTSCPNAIKKKVVINQLSLSLFPSKFLGGKLIGQTEISWAEADNEFDADETDYRLLSALMEPGFQSRRELARKLGMPHSTLDSRLERLRKAGVFRGCIYLRNTRLMGTSEFKLLVSVANRTSKLRDALRTFAKSQPNVITFVELMGDWDFEIGVEVEHPADISAVCDVLRRIFSTELSRVEIVPMLRELKIACFPIKYEPKALRVAV